jgi:hypothetical protein
LACRGADGFGIATVGAHAAFEDGLAVGLVLQVLEDDVEVDIGELAFAEFSEQLQPWPLP